MIKKEIIQLYYPCVFLNKKITMKIRVGIHGIYGSRKWRRDIKLSEQPISVNLLKDVPNFVRSLPR